MYFFFQAEDGIRDLVRSRGLGDVYKRQPRGSERQLNEAVAAGKKAFKGWARTPMADRRVCICLLYTSDAADDLLCVNLGGRRIFIKKNKHKQP
mgnify:CR=1 FL=1